MSGFVEASVCNAVISFAEANYPVVKIGTNSRAPEPSCWGVSSIVYDGDTYSVCVRGVFNVRVI